MFSLVLTFHIALAVLFSGLLLLTAWSVTSSKASFYTPLASLIGIATVLAITSGAYLSLAAAEDALVMCGKAAIYLSVAFISEFVLIRARLTIATQADQ
jgi:hypothetical protein